MAEENGDIVQEFPLLETTGQRVVLMINVKEGHVRYIRKGEVKQSCMIQDLTVSSKNDLQIEVYIGPLEKILLAENSQSKEEILTNIEAIKERHASQPSIYSDDGGSRIIKEGFLNKKGNTVLEKWARRKVCIKQGVIIYYPEQSEKKIKLTPVIECHVEAIGTDKFSVTVPERIYSFQIPASVRDKEEERDNWIKCIRVAIADRTPPQRPGSFQVLPNEAIRKNSKRKPIPKPLVVKQGYLDKQGNAKVKVWNERFIKVESGKFSYALPNKEENTLNVVNLQEGEASVIPTKNFGFDVQIPGRTFHFRVQAKEENKEEAHLNWMKAFNKACCSSESSELPEDQDKKNYEVNANHKEKQPFNDASISKTSSVLLQEDKDGDEDDDFELVTCPKDQGFNRTSCSRTSSVLPKDEDKEIDKGNDLDNTCPTVQGSETVTDNIVVDESSKDTGDSLKGSRKKSKLGSTRSYRGNLREDSLEEPL